MAKHNENTTGKGNKATDNKPIVTAPVTNDAVTAKAVTVDDKTTVAVHVQNSIAPKPVTVGNEQYEIGNKRAYACAMYVVCLLHCNGDKGKAIALATKLLSYGNIGYSKQKGHMLKGGEVTSNGMGGYAKFVTKPDARKLLPGGDSYNDKTKQYEAVCKHILNTYGKVHGADAMAEVSKPK